MDRLLKKLDDLKPIVQSFTPRKIKIEFAKESLTSSGNNPSLANLMFSVMVVFAEF